ncbi:Cryptochrome DASH [Galdieria sulphuraria]|nr:Cryptochrome DASH [Galdieria sulphuraria]
MSAFATLNCKYDNYYFRNIKGYSSFQKRSTYVKLTRGNSSLFWRKQIREAKVFRLYSKIRGDLHRVPESLNGGTAILWFRNNLRLSDNSCLDLANTAEAVLPLYVFDKRSLVRNRLKQQRCGPFRYSFVKESVEQLQNNLRGLFSDLLVEVGTAAEVIRELCAKYSINHIVAPKMISPEEEEYEQEVSQVATELHLNACFVWDCTLLSFDELIVNEYQHSFETFYNSVISKGLPKIFELDNSQRPFLKPLPFGYKPSFAIPLPHLPFPEPRAVYPFRGGEDSAKERLTDYFVKKNGLQLIADLENYSGVMDSSTKLSPWISIGCVSVRQVYWEGYRSYMKNMDSQVANLWLKRFLWRDFLYLLCLQEGSAVFRDRTVNEDAPEFPLYKQSATPYETICNQAIQTWLEGRTGYPYIDAHIKELITTGYISFRGRLNVSSFLVHELDGIWQLGAEFFEHYLIDHDPVINWGYWYHLYEKKQIGVESIQVDTIEEANKYDPDGFYVKKWLNQLVLLPPPFCHEPYLLSEEEQNQFQVILGSDYPEPVLFPTVSEEIERARQFLSSSS